MIEWGIRLPNAGAMASPEKIVAVAKKAEELGYDSLWATDHVVVPRARNSRFPYSPSGKWMWDPKSPYMDPLIALTWAAAVTKRIRLGTGVFLLALREPLTVAKAVSTLDVLSGGRFILGVGSGWNAEEFVAMEIPFSERGARTDEWIRLLKHVWTEEDPNFQGRFRRTGGFGFEPKPVQKPHPPIWIGGESSAAIRRAVRHGDAWCPALLTPEELAPKVKEFWKRAEQAGRQPDDIQLTYRTLVGKPVNKETVEAYRALGVSHIIVDPDFKSTELSLYFDEMEKFAELRDGLTF